jgi:hypothetical protein
MYGQRTRRLRVRFGNLGDAEGASRLEWPSAMGSCNEQDLIQSEVGKRLSSMLDCFVRDVRGKTEHMCGLYHAVYSST